MCCLWTHTYQARPITEPASLIHNGCPRAGNVLKLKRGWCFSEGTNNIGWYTGAQVTGSFLSMLLSQILAITQDKRLGLGSQSDTSTNGKLPLCWISRVKISVGQEVAIPCGQQCVAVEATRLCSTPTEDVQIHSSRLLSNEAYLSVG